MSTGIESNKVPSGVIDGVNKVFTFEKDIYEMLTLWVGGAPYFNYAINGKTVTLDDAPEASYVVPIIGTYLSTSSIFGTSGNITVRQAKTLLSEDGEIDMNNVPNLTRWINELNQMIYGLDRQKNLEKYIQTADVTSIEKQAEYIKPSNFLTINASKLGFYKPSGDDYCLVDETGFTDSSSGYYFEGGKIILTPTPTISGEEYKLRYIPILSQLTADVDETIIEQHYTALVSNYLLYRYWKWDEDFGKASIYDFEFKKSLNEFLGTYGKKKNTRRLNNNTNIYG